MALRGLEELRILPASRVAKEAIFRVSVNRHDVLFTPPRDASPHAVKWRAGFTARLVKSK